MLLMIIHVRHVTRVASEKNSPVEEKKDRQTDPRPYQTRFTSLLLVSVFEGSLWWGCVGGWGMGVVEGE